MQKRTVKEYLELLLLTTVTITIISILCGSYLSISDRQVGSFEYVRKGEDLLEKDKFREAIKYFEKAYASSPENNIIISQLVNAYFKYSSFLAESGDYKRAIDCLNRAYSIKVSSSTIQNLAIMYSKKAASEVQSDPVKAQVDFRTAREIASDSAIASKNLSISLFNNAVAESRAGNDDLAIMFLKESSLTYRDSSTFELLGDIYYKKTEFAKARFYFGKALAMESQYKRVRSKLQKVTKELELTKHEEAESFPHFELRYDKDMLIDADSVRALLEKCYFDVGADLKFFPDSKTTIFLYSQDEFKKIFKLSAAAQAFYDGNIRIPLPGRVLNKDEFANYIYHEYTHAIVYAKTNSNCPVWLNEGVAVWEEYKNRDKLISDTFGKLIDEKQLSIDSLYTAFSLKDADAKELRVYYLLAYSVVKYIIDSWGLEGLRNLLARIKDGRHVANAIEDEFLLSEKEFEKRWKTYVIKKFLNQPA